MSDSKFIRIVRPKHLQRKISTKVTAVPGPAAAQLFYGGGPLIIQPDIVSIYWGSKWTSDPVLMQLEDFYSFIVSSSLISKLQEYFAPLGMTLLPGTHNEMFTIDADVAGNTIDDSAIQAQLNQLIAMGELRPSTANTLYMFHFQSGVVVTGNQLNIGSSCVNFCGYHNDIGSDAFGGPFYGVIPYQDCAGCLGIAGDVLESSTVVIWHEVAEAITDPIPGSGWYDPVNGEIGDICEGNNEVINTIKATVTLPLLYTVAIAPANVAFDGVSPLQLNVTLTPTNSSPPPPPGKSWTVQDLWSNAQNACV